jgi:hypothetical protein
LSCSKATSQNNQDETGLASALSTGKAGADESKKKKKETRHMKDYKAIVTRALNGDQAALTTCYNAIEEAYPGCEYHFDEFYQWQLVDLLKDYYA